LSKSAESSPKIVNRENRYTSHALVEFRKFKFIPIGVHSAVLLDISLGGFKIELTGDKRVKSGELFWLHIPLAPLGIYAPARLMCRGECRWFDPERFRVGGVFTGLSKTERLIIDQVVETLRQRRSPTR
jgi:PilZ domain